MSAYRDGERTIVLIPARFTAAEERQWVTTMVRRLETGEARRRPDDARAALDRAGVTSLRERFRP